MPGAIWYTLDMDETAFGLLGVIGLPGTDELARGIDKALVGLRGSDPGGGGSYLVPTTIERFHSGDAKAVIGESIRNRDIYILADVGNYSVGYELFGKHSLMSPDDHFQNIKRTISALGGKARRLSVVMPLLYAGRQHKRKGRESLDCAVALQELERLGVENIITIDAHDPRVQNAVPLSGFESLHPTFNIVRALVESEPGFLDSDLVTISPDTGAMDKAIYYADVLGAAAGLFYKRRDPSQVAEGRNPIVAHEYLGPPVEGKNVLILDDMISSGESLFDIVDFLNERGAGRIYAAVTFGLFTEGLERFDEYFADGRFARIIATNATYVDPGLASREWFRPVDIADTLAVAVNRLNLSRSISALFDATDSIRELIAARRATSEATR